MTVVKSGTDYRHLPFLLQLSEQQSLFCVQASPVKPHTGASHESVDSLQVSPALQGSPVDRQPAEPSQYSVPSQNSPSSGQLASFGVFEHAPPTQASSVQATPSSQSASVTQPQSMAQLTSFSSPLQVPSPQQYGILPPAGTSVQDQPPVEQSESAQEIGFSPPPAPQQ